MRAESLPTSRRNWLNFVPARPVQRKTACETRTSQRQSAQLTQSSRHRILSIQEIMAQQPLPTSQQPTDIYGGGKCPFALLPWSFPQLLPSLALDATAS